MPSRAPYPVFLDLVQYPVLIVGGGDVALRRAKSLLDAGARLTVVAPEFNPGFDSVKDVERLASPYRATHMARKMWRLVFAATNDPDVNAQVQKHANAAGILVCRCDDASQGDFASGVAQRLNPARGSTGVTLAVHSAGASPVLAARIARQAAAAVDPLLPTLANLLAAWRPTVKAELPDQPRRAALFKKLAGDEMETALRDGGEKAAQSLFAQWLALAREAAARDAHLHAPPHAPPPAPAAKSL